MWKASDHFDDTSAEIDLQIMLVQPGEPKYHALLTKPDDCKQDAFEVPVVGHNYINNFMDTSGFIKGSVYIVDWDWLRQFLGQQFGLDEKILVN